MPRTCRYIALSLFVVTSAVWLYCWFNHRLLAREIWVYLFLYLVPAGLVWGSAWSCCTGPSGAGYLAARC